MNYTYTQTWSIPMISYDDISAMGYWEDPTELTKQQEEDTKEINSHTLFDDYQEWSRTTAIYPEDDARNYLTLGLVSEAGEVAGKVKKYIRDDSWDQDAFISELGDVLWYLARLADEVGVDLSYVAQANRDKLESRKERNTLSGSGDNR